jgi:4-hydroxythreonine-4-phosphate dehydrogenase
VKRRAPGEGPQPDSSRHVAARRSHPIRRLPIALTVGEPAGIGPDLCVLLAQRDLPAAVVVIGDRDLLTARAAALGLPLRLLAHDAAGPRPRGTLNVLHHPLAVAARPGVLDPRNANAVLGWLRTAAEGCMTGAFGGMVTAPVHKGVINDAGVAFTGHTEFLAQLTGAIKVVMMLVGGGMRVALATTHLPLRSVPDALTQGGLESTLRVLNHDLIERFGLVRPRILVAGLNPHAGESGHLGREEIDVIAPVLEKLRAEGMALAGPLPADTLFNPSMLAGADCVLAMYHDQGLPVLKHASFGTAVNVTLGLSIVRTSVDHGTALDRAGKGDIEIGSLLAALDLAAKLAARVEPNLPRKSPRDYPASLMKYPG